VHTGIVAVPNIVPLSVGAGAPPAPRANALLLRVDVPAMLWLKGLNLLVCTETDIGMLSLHGRGCNAAPRLILVSVCQEANPLFAGVVVCGTQPTRTTFLARPCLLP